MAWLADPKEEKSFVLLKEGRGGGHICIECEYAFTTNSTSS